MPSNSQWGFSHPSNRIGQLVALDLGEKDCVMIQSKDKTLTQMTFTECMKDHISKSLRVQL